MANQFVPDFSYSESGLDHFDIIDTLAADGMPTKFCPNCGKDLPEVINLTEENDRSATIPSPSLRQKHPTSGSQARQTPERPLPSVSYTKNGPT
jgi:hypothetical protein